MFALKWRRSGGQAVTQAVHRAIVSGNKARDALDWRAAACAYRAALDGDPDLGHIWVQYGHALKESGAMREALEAYRRAATLRAKDAEPLLHLGRLQRQAGEWPAARESLLTALRLDAGNSEAFGEVLGLASEGDADAASLLLERPGPAGPVQEEAAFAVADHRDSSIAFDVSDLLGYWRSNRLPTGVQRVQIETLSAWLQDPGRAAPRLCAFIARRSVWVEISAADFLRLCTLSRSGCDRDEAAWREGLAGLHIAMGAAPGMRFQRRAFLVSLGLPLRLEAFFAAVRAHKADTDLRYAAFVHDLIPLVAPQHFLEDSVAAFSAWMDAVLTEADAFLVNSDSTRRDLIAIAQARGRPITPDRVAVIRLDGDFRESGSAPLAEANLDRWGLARTPFALFVGSIESRKNHLTAFEAWAAILKDRGQAKTPKLVCVGHRGWLNHEPLARLESDPRLKRHVLLLSNIADGELDLLYRRCLFTLYPSTYEGWGLPVTESLCYGKAPVICNASSLPEAGGPFALYFEAGDPAGLRWNLERLMFDQDFREARERLIREGFRPRPWREIGGDIDRAIGIWRGGR
jgi:glycosyltransferase involved in cell wall biosynthesis